MARLLTCMGELLIDFMPIDEHGTTVGFRMYPGGSPLNIAVAMARLGQPAAFAGKVSTDFFGRRLRAFVEAEGIDTRFLVSDPAQSTLAFVGMESGDPVFTFFGEGAADTLLKPADLPPELFAESAALHVGSISLLRGKTPDAIVAAVERLKGRALLSFDPNIRPGLVQDRAAYLATLDRLFGSVDLVKISAMDLGWLMPDRPVEEAAADLLARGSALVVVTQGGAGVLALRAGAAPLRVPTFRVTVADTVGAGDTFNGGLLAGLAERDALTHSALLALPDAEIVATLRFAGAAAAINCTRPGADPPHRDEVARFVDSQGAA